MREDGLATALDGDDEGRREGALGVVEVRVVVRDAHADEPDVDHIEKKHTPEQGLDRAFDSAAGLLHLASRDGEPASFLIRSQVSLTHASLESRQVKEGVRLTGSAAKRRLHQRSADALYAVLERSGILPVREYQRPTRRRDSTARHDEHEAHASDNSCHLDQTAYYFRMSVNLDREDVRQRRADQEDSNVRRDGEVACRFPVLQDGDTGNDFGRDCTTCMSAEGPGDKKEKTKEDDTY